MPATITFREDAAHDVMTAELTVKNKLGASQFRAVVPLAAIRQALSAQVLAAMKRVDGKTLPVDGIQGDPRFQSRVSGTAKEAALALLQTSAAAPKALAAAALGKRKRKIALIAALAAGGGLAAYGGWRGISALLAKRRAKSAETLRAQGVPDDEIARRLKTAEAADMADLRAANAAAEQGGGEDEDEDEDEGNAGFDREEDGVSGFSFRKLLRTVAAPHTLVTDNPRGFARTVLMPHTLITDRTKAPAAAPRPADDGPDDAPPDAADAPPADAASGIGLNPFAAMLAKKAAANFVPGGNAGLAVAKAASGNPKLQSSALRLAKARKGNPGAKAEIKVVRAAAAKGDPRAKKELARLHAVDAAAKALGTAGKRRSLFDRGVA